MDMRLILIIALSIISSKSFAQKLNPISLYMTTCNSKINDPLCSNYREARENLNNLAKDQFSKVPYNEEVAIITSFILDPKIKTSIKNHTFELKPDSLHYSFSF